MVSYQSKQLKSHDMIMGQPHQILSLKLKKMEKNQNI